MSIPLSRDENQIFDRLVQDLSLPGCLFEFKSLEVDGVLCRVFSNGPQSLSDIYQSAKKFQSNVLVVSGENRVTYDEIFRKAAALGAFLSSHHNIGKGDRVAIAMNNCIEWLISFIAVTGVGATAVLVNSRGTAGEVLAALDVTDCILAIADKSRTKMMTELSEGSGFPIILTNGGDENSALSSHCITFHSAIDGWPDANFNPVAMMPDDEAVVMFTSGTTGGSKAALQSQRSLVSGLMNIQYSMAVVGARIASRYQASKAPLPSAPFQFPSALLSVPLFHSSGCYSIFLSNLFKGGKIVILPKWNATQALDLIERENIVSFSGAPTMLWDLLRVNRDGRDLSGLLSIGVGGQALQPQLLHEIVTAFPNAILGGGYGMTESNGSVCLIAGNDLLERPASSGQVIPTADLKLIGDDGSSLAVGEVGEICLRGAMVMSGYCKRPDETAEVIREGWLRTGDMGRLDEQGYLYVIDRKKDIVISGGENISCTEVEGVVAEHPAVLEAAAFGVADDRLGEILVIAVVLGADSRVVTYMLKRFVAARLAIYKVPRAIMICPQLPRNALGKVKRNELNKLFLEETAG